ncbi:MAG TPA: hypothetical protein VG101_06595 [Puia sp.]|jgi:hypothetical protein|nr:hypothetical protein [Puia sp.]
MDQEANGIWQSDKETGGNIPADRDIAGVHTFVCEDRSVLIYLPPSLKVSNMPEDNVYRLATRWKGSRLYIFLPLGDKWEPFAHWEEDRFVMYGDGKMRVFKKILPGEIASQNRDLLKPGRQFWKYSWLDPGMIDI